MPSPILPQYVQDLKVVQPSKKWFWILLVTIILLFLIGASVLIFYLTRNDATDDSGSTGKPSTVPPDVGTTPVRMKQDSALTENIPSPSFDGKKEIMEMVTNLKTASRSLVTEATWMDPPSKAVLKEKVDYMVPNIGYPDWIMNKASLKNYYNSLSTSRVNYFQSYQNASLFINRQTFRMLRERNDREIWKALPNTRVSLYYPSYNAFTITAGYLRYPFFKQGRLAALNYGAIGSTIGHEITHAFTDKGRSFDKYGSIDGNLRKWWTSTTSTNHQSRVQCLIDQYSNYTSPKGTHLNGKKTQEEDVADNVGLRKAFRAYKLYVAANGLEPKLPGLEQFTSEQLFFVSFANKLCGNKDPESFEHTIQVDTHSLDKFRVIGPLSNNEDFVKQFKCPVGSPMNRENKCVIW